MPRPPASEARDTRRELLDAALELFSEHGFHGTSLRDLARAVGVRESAIYHHFPSKEALLDALMEEPYRNPSMPTHRLAEVAAPDVGRALEQFGVVMLEKMSTLREIKRFRLMMGDGLRLAVAGKLNFWERTGHPREQMEQLFLRLMDEGRLRRTDPEFLALSFMAPMLLWRQLQLLSPKHRYVSDPRAFVRQHVEQFLAGAAVGVAPAGGGEVEQSNSLSATKK